MCLYCRGEEGRAVSIPLQLGMVDLEIPVQLMDILTVSILFLLALLLVMELSPHLMKGVLGRW